MSNETPYQRPPEEPGPSAFDPSAICIAIPSKDRHPSLRRTLISACATGAEVLICDQSAQPFPAGAGYQVLHRPDIQSLPAARNVLLAAAAAYPLIFFIDDDTDLSPDSARQVVTLAKAEPQLAAWGPVIERRSRRQRQLSRLVQWGCLRDPRRLTAGPCNAETGVLFGCAFALRRASALAIGGFDESRRGYCLGEDLDFFRRAQARGLRARLVSRLRAHHREERSNRADPQQRGAAKARFLLWMARRHGRGNPATLVHLCLALIGAASGMGREPGTLRGVVHGLLSPSADRHPRTNTALRG